MLLISGWLQSSFFLATIRYVQPVLVGLLVLVFAWQSGGLISLFFHQPIHPALPHVEHTALSTLTISGTDAFLFGQPVTAAVKKIATPKSVSDTETLDTRLNLVLVGVVDMGDRGVALIKSAGKTLVVSKGETFLPRVTLTDIYPDSVLLDNKGNLERLRLKSDKADKFTRGVKRYNAKTNEQEGVERKDPNLLSSRQQTKLSEIGRKLKKSPMTIAQFLRFKPLNEKGKWVGVKIWSKTDKQLFRAIGLQEGDILKEVNGNSISQMAKKPSLWKAFLKESSFDLVLERNGQLESVSVDFNM